jgi:quercetin dioxygenase-like cupin family protein
MFCFHEKIPKEDLGEGILVQILGSGTNMNTWHWNMRDGSVVSMHQHPQEQFGYVIRGGFRMSIANEEAVLKAGDSYFIPPNAPHMFVAMGETEAIDVFSPKRIDIPWRT